MGLASLGFSNASNAHDDLYNRPGQPLADGSTDGLSAGPDGTAWSNPNTYDPNRGYSAVDPGDGSATVVSPQFDIDVNRYRGMGAQGQAAVNLDQTHSAASRQLQMGALGMLRAQGDGSAPSSAAILAQRANQGAVQNAAMQVTGAKSAGGGIAAARGAGNMAAAQMLAGNATNANVRAGEISRGQGAYAQGAGSLMGQDIGEATTIANLEATQNALNEHRQQAYEKMAWDARNAEMNAANQAHNQDTQRQQAERAQRDAEAQADFNKMKDLASGSVGATTAAAGGASGSGGTSDPGDPNDPNNSGSDPRMKRDIHPMSGLHMGGLSALMRGRR
jgi:hypothetical protein